MNTSFRVRTEIKRIYRVYDAQDIKKQKIAHDDIRTTNKKAKREIKSETNVSDGLGACEITLGELQHKTTKSNKKMK